MPVYIYWGEDDFSLTKAVKHLQQKVLDPNWIQFNYHKIAGDQPDSTLNALNQAMTPPFGIGGRLVWLEDTSLCQTASEDSLKPLERILPVIPDNSYFLLTFRKKPDKRLKTTKLLDKYAEFAEFSPISPWKTDELEELVRTFALEIGVKLTSPAVQLLAESVGNQTRQLWSELEKLKLYAGNSQKSLDTDVVTTLVNATAQNSLQLAVAIRQGNTPEALGLVAELINRNEPALRITATLVGQFRTWTTLKLCLDQGQKDEKEIAKQAEIANPKRIYFLRKEIQSVSSPQLLKALPLLCELEWQLKRGSEPLATLETKIIELCQLFKK